MQEAAVHEHALLTTSFASPTKIAIITAARTTDPQQVEIPMFLRRCDSIHFRSPPDHKNYARRAGDVSNTVERFAFLTSATQLHYVTRSRDGIFAARPRPISSFLLATYRIARNC